MTTRVPLKFVTKLNPDTLAEGTDPELEIDYIEISDVSFAEGIRSSTRYRFEDAPSRARRVVKSGDVLVATVRTYLRAIAAVPLELDGAIASTGFAALRPSSIDPVFLRYAVQEEAFITEVIARSVGVSYPAINAADLVRIGIHIPGPESQIRIATYLSRETGQIDDLITKQEQLIATLAERRQAVIIQAVTRGLNPKAELEDSGVSWIGTAPKAWTLPKLGWQAKIGNGSTPSRESPNYWEDGDVPWLNSSVVNRREVSHAEQKVTAQAVRECHLPLVKSGSLLVGLTGQGKTRGAVTMLAISSTINQHLAYITFRGQLERGFAYWALKAAYGHLRSISDGNGGTKGGLTCEELRQFRIPMPPKPEQLTITKFLDSATARLDALSASATRMIALLRERRQALISAAVTGKIDVRGPA